MKNISITGANKGIGFETAKHWLNWDILYSWDAEI